MTVESGASRGGKLATASACASRDSFILLTQRMERAAAGGSPPKDREWKARETQGETPARTWPALKLDEPLDSEKFSFSKRSGTRMTERERERERDREDESREGTR